MLETLDETLTYFILSAIVLIFIILFQILILTKSSK